METTFYKALMSVDAITKVCIKSALASLNRDAKPVVLLKVVTERIQRSCITRPISARLKLSSSLLLKNISRHGWMDCCIKMHVYNTYLWWTCTCDQLIGALTCQVLAESHFYHKVMPANSIMKSEERVACQEEDVIGTASAVTVEINDINYCIIKTRINRFMLPRTPIIERSSIQLNIIGLGFTKHLKVY